MTLMKDIIRLDYRLNDRNTKEKGNETGHKR